MLTVSNRANIICGQLGRPRSSIDFLRALRTIGSVGRETRAMQRSRTAN